jgi:phytoene dehydrogenase-like protein
MTPNPVLCGLIFFVREGRADGFIKGRPAMDFQVIVIGGGYAGLSAGAILAHKGYRVLLLERSRQLGGRASFLERDGYTVEYGLHDNRLGPQGAAAAVFRRIGKELKFLEPGDPELWKEGAFYPLPNSTGKIFRSPLLSFGSRLTMARYMLKLVLGNPAKKYGVSMEEFTHKVRSPAVLELLRVLSGICIIAPDLRYASAGELGAFLKKALRARMTVGYPEGGTRQIIEGLSAEIGERGQIVMGGRVSKLVIKKGLVTQVKTEANTYSADVVISALPLQHVPDLFGGKDLPIKFVKKAREMVPTAGIAFDIGLKQRVSGQDGLVVSSDPLTMGQFTSNIDPSMAPEGKQLLSWYYPLPQQWIRNSEKMQREEQRLRDLLDSMYPGIWDAVDWERVMHVPMVDGFLPRPGQTRADRPDFTVPAIENFFLCGDGTKAEGTGGDTAFNSAIHVSGLAAKYLGENPEGEEEEMEEETEEEEEEEE